MACSVVTVSASPRCGNQRRDGFALGARQLARRRADEHDGSGPVLDAVAIRLADGRAGRRATRSENRRRPMFRASARSGAPPRPALSRAGAGHVPTEVADEHACRDARVHAQMPLTLFIAASNPTCWIDSTGRWPPTHRPALMAMASSSVHAVSSRILDCRASAASTLRWCVSGTLMTCVTPSAWSSPTIAAAETGGPREPH